jgi:integrase
MSTDSAGHRQTLGIDTRRYPCANQWGIFMPKLTAKSVENMKPGAERIEVPDRGCSGLYLIVQPSGAKSWAVRYRRLGKPRKLTLGNVEAMSLAAAHSAAKDALHDLADGKDPAADKQQRLAESEQAAALRASDTVDALVAQFLTQYVERNCRPGTQYQVRRILTVEVLPRWRGRSVHDIQRRDVVALLDKISVDRPVLANRTRSYLSKFFNWLMARDVIKFSPVAGVEQPAKETARDRVLTPAEVTSVWSACDRTGGDFADLVKLLLLLGQRRSEVAGMCWSEIDDKRVWTIPAARCKNGKQHSIPLSRQAWAIVSARPRTGERVLDVGSVAHGKIGLDAVARIPTRWTLHDLRRTAVTGMAELGIAPHIIEAVVNHTGAAKLGVAGVYNRASYAAEKAAALQQWADHIDSIVGPAAAANVVRLRSSS